MQIGGTLINGLVRVLVVVGTLAAAYYFIVRPVLDTTEKVSSGINTNIQKSLDDVNEAFEGSGISSGTKVQIQREIKNGQGVNHDRLIKCIQRATQNYQGLAAAQRMQRCSQKFGP